MLQLRRDGSEDGALAARDSGVQLSVGEAVAGQRDDEVVVRVALEDLAGDDEGDDDGPDLGDVLEGDGVGDILGGDLDGGDGVAGLQRGAGAEGDEDAVAVDVRDRRVGGDGVHERAADQHEDAAAGVDGHVVADFREQGAREHVGADGDEDKGEQAHRGHEGGVVLDELEIDGDVVDGDEEARDGCGGAEVEEDLRAGAEQVVREHAVVGCGENVEILLESEGRQEDPKDDEEDDGAGIFPRPCAASKGQNHREGDPEARA